jgi:hypothetical protein
MARGMCWWRGKIPAFAGMTKGVGMTRGVGMIGGGLLTPGPRCRALWLSLVPRSVATVPDPMATVPDPMATVPGMTEE